MGFFNSSVYICDISGFSDVTQIANNNCARMEKNRGFGNLSFSGARIQKEISHKRIWSYYFFANAMGHAGFAKKKYDH